MTTNNSDKSFWDMLTSYDESDIRKAMIIYEVFPWLTGLDENTVEKLLWVDESTVIDIFKNRFEKESFFIDSLNDAKTSKELEGIFYKTQDKRTLYNCSKINDVLWNVIIDVDEVLDAGVAFKQIIEKELEFRAFQARNKS